MAQEENTVPVIESQNDIESRKPGIESRKPGIEHASHIESQKQYRVTQYRVTPKFQFKDSVTLQSGVVMVGVPWQEKGDKEIKAIGTSYANDLIFTA